MKEQEFISEIVARVCHEANKAWCETNGDFTQKAWEEAEEWQRESAINGVTFCIATPDAARSIQHDNWMNEKIAKGWIYGKVKDTKAKTHPCIVPFEELPKFQQKKDELFCAIVNALKE